MKPAARGAAEEPAGPQPSDVIHVEVTPRTGHLRSQPPPIWTGALGDQKGRSSHSGMRQERVHRGVPSNREHRNLCPFVDVLSRPGHPAYLLPGEALVSLFEPPAALEAHVPLGDHPVMSAEGLHGNPRGREHWWQRGCRAAPLPSGRLLRLMLACSHWFCSRGTASSRGTISCRCHLSFGYDLFTWNHGCTYRA